MASPAARVCDYRRALQIVDGARPRCQHVQSWLRDESVMRSWYVEAEADPRRMLSRIECGDMDGRLDGEMCAELLLYCHDLLRHPRLMAIGLRHSARFGGPFFSRAP